MRYDTPFTRWVRRAGPPLCLLALCVPMNVAARQLPVSAAAGAKTGGAVAEYRVGPGDQLSIAVYGIPELTQTSRVSNSGKIHVARVGVLNVYALTAQKRILVQFRVVRKINSKITGEYNQNITGVRVVKALGREDANLADFTGRTNEMYGVSYRAAWLSALFLPAVQLISSFAVGVVVLYAGLDAGVGG